jgi:hypothetical protein
MISADLGIVLLEALGTQNVERVPSNTREAVQEQIAGRLLGQAERVVCVGHKRPAWMDKTELPVKFLNAWTPSDRDVQGEDCLSNHVLSGIDWIKSRMGKNATALTVPGFCNRFPHDLIDSMNAARGNSDIVFVKHKDVLLPEFALWNVGAFEAAYRLASETSFSTLKEWLQDLGAQAVSVRALDNAFDMASEFSQRQTEKNPIVSGGL